MTYPWVLPVSRSTADNPPSSGLGDTLKLLLKSTLIIICFAMAYSVASCWAAMPSERVYYAWPPTALLIWAVFHTPQRLTRARRYCLALAAGLLMRGVEVTTPRGR